MTQKFILPIAGREVVIEWPDDVADGYLSSRRIHDDEFSCFQCDLAYAKKYLKLVEECERCKDTKFVSHRAWPYKDGHGETQSIPCPDCQPKKLEKSDEDGSLELKEECEKVCNSEEAKEFIARTSKKKPMPELPMRLNPHLTLRADGAALDWNKLIDCVADLQERLKGER